METWNGGRGLKGGDAEISRGRLEGHFLKNTCWRILRDLLEIPDVVGDFLKNTCWRILRDVLEIPDVVGDF